MPNGGKTVKARYTKSQDYRIVHSDGAMGGMTPRGEFRIEFIVTLPPEVTSEEIEVGPKGKTKSKGLATDCKDLVRERQVCVLMSMESARNLAEWLSKQVPDNA